MLAQDVPTEVGPPRINGDGGEHTIDCFQKIRGGYIECFDWLRSQALEVDYEVEAGCQLLELGAAEDVAALPGVAHIGAGGRGLGQQRLDVKNSLGFGFGSLHRIAAKHEYMDHVIYKSFANISPSSKVLLAA